MEVMNRVKGLDLVDRAPEELWTEVLNIVQEAVTKTTAKKYNQFGFGIDHLMMSICRVDSCVVLPEFTVAFKVPEFTVALKHLSLNIS